MSFLALLLIGLAVGVTTVLFGFGGGFVTVPVVAVADLALGGDAVRVAAATSALVMLVNAAVATASTRRETLRVLAGRGGLFALLALGGGAGALLSGAAPDAAIRWGFVAYIGATVLDLLLRPGFFRPRTEERTDGSASGVPTWLGLPIGGLAAFLGVGGSVMTVPIMRRSGATMPVATALANPLTLAIAVPAFLVSLLAGVHAPEAAGLAGFVDLRAAFSLLVGSIPVVLILRRRPPRISEALHAWSYLALLIAAGATVAAPG